MALDLLSLPPTLVSLDGVPPEFVAMYEIDEDGLYVMTETGRANLFKVAEGIQLLAEQRDVEARKAREAAKSAAVMSAVLLAGAQGVLAAAACAQYEAENTITMSKGLPVVQTDGGEVPLRDAISEWMTSGDGAAFLPSHKAEKHDDYFQRQIRR
jgi:hypothetical protein